MNARAAYERAYRREHPLAICFTLGVAFVGFLTLLDPSAVEQSATYLALPELLRKAFNVSYAFGGATAAYGLIRVDHRIEGAGMSLLGSALAVQWISVLYVSPKSWLSAMFIVALAVGCGLRAWVLARP